MRLGFQNPVLSAELNIWGAHEREKFGEMLTDHRYVIERLLLIPALTFDTSRGFSSKKRNGLGSAFKNLAEYYRTDDESGCDFTLMRELDNTSSEADIIATVQPLLALYDSALAYCLPKRPKNARGRMLEHLNLIGA